MTTILHVGSLQPEMLISVDGFSSNDDLSILSHKTWQKPIIIGFVVCIIIFTVIYQHRGKAHHSCHKPGCVAPLHRTSIEY